MASQVSPFQDRENAEAIEPGPDLAVSADALVAAARLLLVPRPRLKIILLLQPFEVPEVTPFDAADGDSARATLKRICGAAAVCLRKAVELEAVAREQPGFVPAYWRSARSFWMAGDTLPLEAKLERISRFELSEALAARGIEVDSGCAECMLWKFAAMGRLRRNSSRQGDSYIACSKPVISRGETRLPRDRPDPSMIEMPRVMEPPS